MNIKEELIFAVQNQLNIQSTHDSSGLCRAIYSASGKMALASLWDQLEDSDFISIQHFKSRISQILTSFISIYPVAEKNFPKDLSALINDIYEIYRRNGFFYHANYRLTPAPLKQACSEGCTLFRGLPPNGYGAMSGLGLYSTEIKGPLGQTISDLFELQTQPLLDYLQNIWESGEWKETDWPDDTQFLRMKPPFSRGYWQEAPEKTDRISLAHYGSPNKFYVFYRYWNDRFQEKAIPSWRVCDFRSAGNTGYGEYRRIANALLKKEGQLPPILAVRSPSFVQLKLGYRLPPTEEDFFMLYSWPVHYMASSEAPQVFHREMAPAVYPVFKKHLESLGYQILEE